MSGWNDARVDTLKKLWAEGLSASQIATELGSGITRNAVIGKVHRLGLSGRVKVAKQPEPLKSKLPLPALTRRVRDDGLRKQASDRQAQKVGGVASTPMAEEHVASRSEEVVTAPGGDYNDAANIASSGPNVDILGLNSTNCHWPLGAVTDRPPYRFCGAPTEPDKPYCEHHAKMARSGEQGRRVAPKSDPAKRELLRITMTEVAE